MQQAKQATFRQYVMAGNTLASKEHILVSSHVNLENPGEEDARDVFLAGQTKRAAVTVSYNVAALVLILCAAICLGIILGRTALTRRLEGEYAQLGVRFQAAQLEQQRLEAEFLQKSDASGICYYAVQSLGMRLAGDKETVGVQAAGLPGTMYAEPLRGTAFNNH